MNKIAHWIVEQYKKLIVRLSVTVTIITITQIVYRYCISELHNSQTPLYVYFQNVWLTSAYVTTTLITGILFACIYFTANGDVKDEGLWGFFVCLVFISITIVSIFQISNSKKWLIFIPVIYASFVFFIDWRLSRAGLKKLKEIYFPFDLAVLVGVIAVAILQMVNKNENLNLIYGFGGGGAAFQLIMANIVFDPQNYIQNQQKEGDNHDKN